MADLILTVLRQVIASVCWICLLIFININWLSEEQLHNNNISTSRQMGYNSACSVQTCSANCCNYYGYCPDSSSSYSSQNQCWYYYYSDYSSTCSSYTGTSITCCYSSSVGYYTCNNGGNWVGVIVGSVVGGVVGLVLLVVGIVFLCRKCNQNTTMPVPQRPNPSTVIISGPPHAPIYPPVYNPAVQVQTVQTQPAYISTNQSHL